MVTEGDQGQDLEAEVEIGITSQNIEETTGTMKEEVTIIDNIAERITILISMMTREGKETNTTVIEINIQITNTNIDIQIEAKVVTGINKAIDIEKRRDIDLKL